MNIGENRAKFSSVENRFFSIRRSRITWRNSALVEPSCENRMRNNRPKWKPQGGFRAGFRWQVSVPRFPLGPGLFSYLDFADGRCRGNKKPHPEPDGGFEAFDQ